MEIITDQANSDLTPIQKFYSGQSIFITGGTGFLGKALIEKLLRSCSDLSMIYILIRPKKEEDVEKRMEKIFEDVVFDRLKKEVPKYRYKLTAVAGDCRLPGLGLSADDKNTVIRNVSIFFHVAATVRFDEKLKDAVAINVGGTKAVLDLCRSMSNLKALVHVSTAYSNCNRQVIDEKFYKPPITGDKIMKLMDSLEDERIEVVTDAMLEDFPNTYCYTKCIAEQVVHQHGKDLPIGIYRPAIVISTYKEPLKGWVDNIYGPTGALVGGGAGLIKTLKMDKNATAELIPADLTVNALIACAWSIANKKNEDADPPIYNYHSTWNNKITWGKYMDLAFKYGKKYPASRSIWCYSVTSTKNQYVYWLLTLLLHMVPALLVDIGFFLAGKKPRLLKAYKKIHKFADVTAFFSMNSWTFSNKNVLDLWDSLTDADREIFYFSMKDFDWEDFMNECIVGLRLYIFKDDPSTLSHAKRRMSWFVFFHRLIKYSSWLLASWLLYRTLHYVLGIGAISAVTSLNENLIER